ncbi:helix-turn-helix domain-containing protein [Ihubacter sp. rT4E-8]|uniref:helix-turn-helix domain-containing protein n=1 Tax=unclassified Ihubacter TaxID=2633299 RepID=UPI00137965ED
MENKDRNSQIAENLRYIRTVFGYTQSDIAKVLHVCRCTYVQYETGRMIPHTESLMDLAQFYGITIDTLLGDPKKSFSDHILFTDYTDNQLPRLLSIFSRLTDEQQQCLLHKAQTLQAHEKAWRHFVKR